MAITNSINSNRILESRGGSVGFDAAENRLRTGITREDVVVVRANSGGSWHELHVEAPEGASWEEWVRIAGFDQWEMVTREMYLDGFRTFPNKEGVADYWAQVPSMVKVPKARALVRQGPGDYEEIFGVVSDQYKPVQPLTQVQVFRKFLEAGDCQLETLGSLYAGRKVWALLNLGRSWRIAGTNDEVRAFLMVANANDGTGAFWVKLVMERVVCANTFRRAGNEKSDMELRFTHRKDWTAATAGEIATMTGLFRDQFQKEEGHANKLAAAHLTEEQVYEYVARVSGSADAFRTVTGKPVADIDNGAVLEAVLNTTEMADEFKSGMMVDPSKLNRVGSRILNYMLEGTPGSAPLTAQGLSAWNALNHVTAYATHDRRISRTNAGRVDSSLMGAAADMKDQAAVILHQMVEARA